MRLRYLLYGILCVIILSVGACLLWKYSSVQIVVPSPASFKITKQSLEKLKSEGVPDSVLKKIELILKHTLSPDGKAAAGVPESIPSYYSDLGAKTLALVGFVLTVVALFFGIVTNGASWTLG